MKTLRISAALALALGTAGPAAAATPEEACSIAKTKAAGAYAACRQKAAAKALQKGTEPVYGKCDAKFQSSWGKAEAKAGKKGAECADDAESEDVRGQIAADTDAISTLLAGGGEPPPQAPDPQCEEPYLVLDRAHRNVAATGPEKFCDSFVPGATVSPQWQGSGWYRFAGEAGTRMPESPPPAGGCGSDLGGWLNGTHPETSEGVVTRDLCFAFETDSCAGGVFEDGLEVVNCGTFFLYHLPYVGACRYRYCAE